MTVTSVDKDPSTCTMQITAEFDAPVERVWRLWSDPRLLERWWGPPTYPATVDEHDLSVGGHVAYHMTGPEGDQPRGWWKSSWSSPHTGSSSRTASPMPTADPIRACRRCG